MLSKAITKFSEKTCILQQQKIDIHIYLIGPREIKSENNLCFPKKKKNHERYQKFNTIICGHLFIQFLLKIFY